MAQAKAKEAGAVVVAAVNKQAVKKEALKDVMVNLVRPVIEVNRAKISKVLENVDPAVTGFQTGLPLIKGGRYALKILIKVDRADNRDAADVEVQDLDSLVAQLSEV